MENEFLEWIRQANGLLLEAYRRQARECRLCWEEGELHFQVLISNDWQVIKSVPLESSQYVHLFNLATQMLDDGGYFQIRVPEATTETMVAYQINFLFGDRASDSVVRLALVHTDNEMTLEVFDSELLSEDDQDLDSEYIN